MKPPVLTKKDFVERYARGEFGNASPTWNSYVEWLAATLYDPCEGRLFHVRNRTAGGQTFYNVPKALMKQTWESASKLSDGWYISEMAPSDKTLFQGEVMRSPRYLELTYNTLPLPMREGMLRGMKHAHGIIASSLLKHFLCPNSYEWLWYLLDEYPNHIVEFSSYRCQWGTIPGYNTVFWEVRGGY